jgi:hypothetical protein
MYRPSRYIHLSSPSGAVDAAHSGQRVRAVPIPPERLTGVRRVRQASSAGPPFARGL